MARGRAIVSVEDPPPLVAAPAQPPEGEPTGLLTLVPLVLPAASVVRLSEIATRRGVSVASLLQAAIDQILAE